jgi:hypothetical protein
VVLAAVYVPATDTAIQSNQLVDKRMILGALFHQSTMSRQSLGF